MNVISLGGILWPAAASSACCWTGICEILYGYLRTGSLLLLVGIIYGSRRRAVQQAAIRWGWDE